MSNSVPSPLEILVEEAKDAPEEILEEVLDFFRFLQTKQEEPRQVIDLSKTAFAKDWDLPEEDEAWRGL